MSTALQRLLARPSSLTFLQLLIRMPVLEDDLQRARKVSCIYPRHVRHRRCITAASGVLGIETLSLNGAEVGSASTELAPSRPAKDHSEPEPEKSSDTLNETLLPPILDSRGSRTAWSKYMPTFESVDYQSNLDLHIDGKGKLVDSPKFRDDFMLWAYLVDFRKRKHGNKGVSMFWKAVRERGLQLPTEGPLAYKLWPTFLEAGLENEEMLSEICQYADDLYNSSGKRWPGLYVYIIEHIFFREECKVIEKWHNRLIRFHPPDPGSFERFVRAVVSRRGDFKALKLLYGKYKGHNTYCAVIPVLLEQENFRAAYRWHFFLVSRGDVPSSKEVVEPLIRFFAVFNPPKASKLARSLVSAGVPYASSISVVPAERNQAISREMINLVHGEAFGIEPKGYNDQLGARWFATGWISLDLAINTIHALGVLEIGPLSLQSIALREADTTGVVRRLDHLKELGISIGSSVFSKAVESFARNGQVEYLQGLLKSDQHPDSFEDKQLQESLLAAYARAGDWRQYRLISAVSLARPIDPQLNSYNLTLRTQIISGDQEAVFKALEEMRMKRIAVTQDTVYYLLQNFLEPRRKGNSLDDLQRVISILTAIMKFGNYVPVTLWREIIRRLGMLGRLYDLEVLCIWLTAWYKPHSTLRSRSVGFSSPMLPVQRLHQIPAQVRTTHPLHPLRILFSNHLQRAIVEWGFKHAPVDPSFKSTVLDISGDVESVVQQRALHYTRGVKFLRRLREEGVCVISTAQLRKAVKTRLVMLYEPGESRLRRNRRLKQQNVFPREYIEAQINKAWGSDIF